MVDRPPISKTFEHAADREIHEREQLDRVLRTLSEEKQEFALKQIEEAGKERDKEKEQEIKAHEQRMHEHDEKVKKLIARQQPEPAFTLYGSSSSRLNPHQALALEKQSLEAGHKNNLQSIETDLSMKIAFILASHAPEKKRELDEIRERVRESAEKQREERKKTRPDEERNPDHAEKEPERDTKTRNEDYLKRVADRMRNIKERNERGKDRDDHERD